jgi:signal transduction histidine kinase
VHEPEDQPEDLRRELARVRRGMRDLVALGGLRALWAEREPRAIVESLAEVLLDVLGADLVFVQLDGATGWEETAVLRILNGAVGREAALESALRELAAEGEAGAMARSAHLPGLGPVALSAVPLGLGGEYGWIIASSKRSDFPSDAQRSLLVQGANQAAMALRERELAQRRGVEALSRSVVRLQEEERRKIAGELHDEVGQLLTALRLMLETDDPTGSTARREEMQRTVAELMGRVRDLSLDLRPPMLDELGLVPTLLWHVERFAVRTGVEVDLRCARLDRRLDAELEITVFRIVQEALTNVARHAGVKRAQVEVWASDQELGLRVEDRGRGFDVAAALAAPTSGLGGMRERCRLLGGTLTIQSEPGGGTRLAAEFPLAPRQAPQSR